jgi:hypothetical protein
MRSMKRRKPHAQRIGQAVRQAVNDLTADGKPRERGYTLACSAGFIGLAVRSQGIYTLAAALPAVGQAVNHLTADGMPRERGIPS